MPVSAPLPCPDCSEPIRDSVPQCPHCGRPSRFPNVNAAQRLEEKAELGRRYEQALAAAQASGDRDALEAFEAAVAAASQAVICRPFSELQRLAFSDDEVYVTYYIRQQSRVPGGSRWDALRSQADTLIFGDHYKKEIRFAALTLSGTGPTSYGECSLLLKEEMIAHRTSLFEENSVFFVRRLPRDVEEVPPGHRAEWADRGRLAALKLATIPEWKTLAHAELLLAPAADTSADRFVEAHIWGSITVRSFFQVTVNQWEVAAPSELEIEATEGKLSRFGIGFTHP